MRVIDDCCAGVEIVISRGPAAVPARQLGAAHRNILICNVSVQDIGEISLVIDRGYHKVVVYFTSHWSRSRDNLGSLFTLRSMGRPSRLFRVNVNLTYSVLSTTAGVSKLSFSIVNVYLTYSVLSTTYGRGQ